MTVRKLRELLFEIEAQDEEITLEEIKKMMEEDERKKSRPARREDSPRWCIFEKKICRYANKNGNAFTCEAPSDDDMICR